ncbi:protein disulfide isomerase FrnE [soil metagenome]
MQKLRLDIWSDIVCPWCYIGKRHLEQALATFEHDADVEVVWHAFELDPSAPKVRTDGFEAVERLSKKYGVSVAEGQQMIDRVINAGKSAGLDLRLHEAKSGNTFDAHRLLHWAHDQGKQGVLKERLLRGYMTEAKAIGDHEVLVELAQDVGLDEAAARAVLASDQYATEVRQDEATAKELGINGVPFFVMAGKLGISGAQPAEVLKGALAKAWSIAQSERPQLEPYADGAACGPQGCD